VRLIAEIGESAGTVWRTLSEKGEMPMSRLRKSSGLGPTAFLLGLGWLAREGKVAFRQEENKTIVSLVGKG
jgi:hypothetical protein